MRKKRSSFFSQQKKRDRNSSKRKSYFEEKRRKITYGREEEDFSNLLFKYDLSDNFLDKSLEELKIYDKLDFEAIYAKRKDLSSNFIITIDGETAKDFDDAISVSKEENDRYRLGVHIADVSFFVHAGSSLDLEAFDRGTSVYLIDRVVPMLPFRLSNDLCSLVEGRKRLTLTCDMTINSKGEIYSYEFYFSVIENKRRTTYKEVESVLSGENSFGDEFDAFIKLCLELRNILHAKRVNEGSVEIESNELDFKLDGEGHVIDVHEKERLFSESIIEEFMLSANQCAANFLKKHDTGIFRVHEAPYLEKLEAFNEIVKQKGFDLPKGGSFNPLLKKAKNKYQIFLEQIKDRSLKKIFSYYLLTSFNKAVYDENSVGHYGLAFKNYTHFTSPIRRYPDLIVHRLIQKIMASKIILYKKKALTDIAKQSSHRERRAVDAEREYWKLKSMRYLQNKIDEKFECIVSGKTEFGYFLKELKTGIEGFCQYSYYLPPKENKSEFEVGDRVWAKLVSLDFRNVHIDFRITDPDLESGLG